MITAHAIGLSQLATDAKVRETTVPGSSPVPFFGRADRATVATVGINPSNREFEGTNGVALNEAERRFPTLESEGLSAWDEADTDHLRAMVDSGLEYFSRNPYDRWFGVLERAMSLMPATYHGPTASAFHVDLVPYATRAKWGSLGVRERRMLVERSRAILVEVVATSPVEMLILNGAGVVQVFESIADVSFKRHDRPEWNLTQASGRVVRGESISGTLESLGGTNLQHPVKVVGFNINLQSSFGVTSEALRAVGRFLASEYQSS